MESGRRQWGLTLCPAMYRLQGPAPRVTVCPLGSSRSPLCDRAAPSTPLSLRFFPSQRQVVTCGSEGGRGQEAGRGTEHQEPRGDGSPPGPVPGARQLCEDFVGSAKHSLQECARQTAVTSSRRVALADHTTHITASNRVLVPATWLRLPIRKHSQVGWNHPSDLFQLRAEARDGGSGPRGSGRARSGHTTVEGARETWRVARG